MIDGLINVDNTNILPKLISVFSSAPLHFSYFISNQITHLSFPSSVISLLALSLASAQDPCAGKYPCEVGGFPQALTPGNVIAMRVGSIYGPSDIRIKSSKTDNIIGPTFMDEIDMKGNLVQTLDLGTLKVPIRMSLWTGGTGPSEGLITTSYINNYVIFGGYNMPIGWSVKTGPGSGKLPTINANLQYRQSTWPEGVNYPPRIVARVGVDGKIAIIAQDYNAMNGDTLRSTCSYDGESAYMVGHAMPPFGSDGSAIADPYTKSSPIMYYAGKGAAGVAILENTIAQSTDTYGNSRGCYISDALSPGKPKLYVTAHAKYYYQWDTGRSNYWANNPSTDAPIACACNTTNPAKVKCEGQLVPNPVPIVACQASGTANTNIDRGVFEITTLDGKLPTGTSKADYKGLTGVSADSRDPSSRETVITSIVNFERFCNFYFTDSNTMYVSDAAWNTGTNWYATQASKTGGNNMVYAPGILKFVKDNSGAWKFTPRVGYATSGETITGGVIDGGYASNDLTVGKCDGKQYVFWASADFQNAGGTGASLGSRLRYYRDDNGDIANIAAMSDSTTFGLNSTMINTMMWRGIQWVPCTDTSNTCPGKVNTRNICTSKGSGAISNSAGLVTAAVAVAGTVAAALW